MNRRIIEDDNLIICNEDGEPVLTIQEQFESGVMRLSLKGSITTQTAHEFEDELIAAVTVCDQILVDCAELNLIASSGLKVLLEVQKHLDQRKNGMLKLVSLTKPVRQIFEDTGFADLFEIE